MRSRLFRSISRRLRSFIKKVVVETVKESKVNRGAFRRDAIAATHFFYLEGLSRESKTSGLYQGPARDTKVIVSLTSIQSRLFDIATTVESLLQQSYKPDEIVLWLDQERLTEEALPLTLKAQMQRGLSVRFCQDIGPHTKLLPAMSAYPDAVIVTVDDDILYPSNALERLVANHRTWPDEILCFRARRIHLPLAGETKYLDHWPNHLEEHRGLDVVPLGVGGVLYPPNCLDPEVFNLKAQKELAPKADDVWFKAMSLKAGTVCHRIQAPKEPHSIRPNSGDDGLEAFNVGGGGNDIQIAATFGRYDLWKLLASSPGVLRLSPK